MGIGFFVHHRIVPAIKRVQFVNDRMPCIVLGGNIIVLNVHAPCEEKINDTKDIFYEKLEQVFDHFPKYHMKSLVGDFNAKVGKKEYFQTDNRE